MLTLEHTAGLQRFMLEAEHLKRLKEDTGIEPNHFEQHEGEVVFIPAGCPHQVGVYLEVPGAQPAAA